MFRWATTCQKFTVVPQPQQCEKTLRGLVEWDESRVTCWGIKEILAHMLMQLKGGPRPGQTPVILARPTRGHGSPSHVEQSDEEVVVTSSVKVPCAQTNTSGIKAGEMPYKRYSHLNRHNGAINIQTNVRVCSIKNV